MKCEITCFLIFKKSALFSSHVIGAMLLMECYRMEIISRQVPLAELIRDRIVFEKNICHCVAITIDWPQDSLHVES